MKGQVCVSVGGRRGGGEGVYEGLVWREEEEMCFQFISSATSLGAIHMAPLDLVLARLDWSGPPFLSHPVLVILPSFSDTKAT